MFLVCEESSSSTEAGPRDAETERALRDWWSTIDAPAKLTWTSSDAENPKIRRAVMEARRFAVDSKLEIWVEDQNINKGINPASANVIREGRDARHAAGLAVPTSQRQWLRRWRARRGLRLRAFAPLEPLERSEMHEKAADQARSRFWLHRSRCFGRTVGHPEKKVTVFRS